MTTTDHSDDTPLQSAVASYQPDRQLITFSERMMVAPKTVTDAAPGGFQDPRSIAYFFHEWMHYLHNVSTIHGVSAFLGLAELWSAFRYTTDTSGIGQGRIDGATLEQLRTEELLTHRRSLRRRTQARLPEGTRPDQVDILALTDATLDGQPNNDHLTLHAQYSNTAGDTARADITIGPGEILESVAYLLEKRFLWKMAAQEPEPAAVLPYHALSLLAQKIAPDLNEEQVLLCGLASLQSTSPVDALLSHLRGSTTASSEQLKHWRTHLGAQVSQHLRCNEPVSRAWLDRLQAMFPVPQNLGLAAQETIAFMRSNLQARLADPFFELGIIDVLCAPDALPFGERMNALMTKHGICSLMQQHPGTIFQIGRDTLHDFAVAGRNAELNEGRRILQASFEFMLRHLSQGGAFVATADTPPCRCPFFTSCVDPARAQHEERCNTTPWQIVDQQDASCFYALGIVNLRSDPPPQTATSLVA